MLEIHRMRWKYGQGTNPSHTQELKEELEISWCYIPHRTNSALPRLCPDKSDLFWWDKMKLIYISMFQPIGINLIITIKLTIASLSQRSFSSTLTAQWPSVTGLLNQAESHIQVVKNWLWVFEFIKLGLVLAQKAQGIRIKILQIALRMAENLCIFQRFCESNASWKLPLEYSWSLNIRV